MTKFRIINNATTLINNDFIFDPWIYGNVFEGVWSPYPNPNFKKNNLKKIKFCFISHIHQDHWDLETIKFFPKNTKFFIPNLKFNQVIGNTLKKNGFKNLVYIDSGKWIDISSNYEICLVPPLNAYGAETDEISSKDDDAIAIDTGLIINIKKDNSNHMLMGDNVPYDINLYNKYFKKTKINSFFFPHNGFAMDYPLCYDNFTLKEKKRLSLEKAIKTEKKIIRFINIIKPEVIIPFSAEFSINNSRKNEFSKVNSSIFYHKDKYAKRIENLTNIKSYGLYQKDELIFSSNKFYIKNKSTFKDKRKIRKNVKIKLPRCDLKLDFESLLKISLEKYFDRIKKYKINLSKLKDWNFIIKLENDKSYIIDYKRKTLISKNNPNKKCLELITSKNIMQCILERKLHMNNCMVSFVLSWKRKPNIYCKELYDSLSFLHI